MAKVLGLTGRKGVGKDTAAEVLLDNGWARLSFADPLKDLCAATFDIKPAKFYNPEFKDVIFTQPIILSSDHADNFMAGLDTPIYGHAQANLIYDAFDGKILNTARELLQFIGTDVIRNCVSNTYWIDIAEKKLQNWIERDTKVVFTDVRFPNERDLIKDYKGIVVKITRNKDDKESILDNHISESLEFKVDTTISNNGTVEELHHLIKEVI